MISGPFEYTPSGKKKAPTRNLVFRWVNEAWQEIRAEMVVKNALDRREDDELYTEDGQEIEVDEDNKFDTESEGESDADGE